MKLLVVEDDPVLTDGLAQLLTGQRYLVETASDGKMGWDYAQTSSYDLLLVDVGLPKLDGITLCQRLRSQGCATPILLMTAKDAPQERIRGLDAGADDYLTKPLVPEELLARVRALLRRGQIQRTPLLEMGDLKLDPTTCQVTYADKILNLTPKEYSLLELFLRNPGRVYSRGQLVEHLWTFDDPPQEDSVKAHIKGLRQKLKAAGASDWIENVYGLGYRLNPVMSAKSDPPPLLQQPASLDQASSTIEQDFTQAMQGLWDRYQGLMQDRLQILQQTVQSLQTGILTEPLRQQASQAAHKLAGVLGMFEREEGTRVARLIEQSLDAHQGQTLDPQQLTEWVTALQRQMQPSIPQVADAPVWEDPRSNSGLQPQPPRLGQSALLAVKVLVVDDDPIFLATLPPMLQPWGIQLTTLADPEQFWQVLPTVEPDLVILDVDMPRLTGIELCQSVRQDPDWQGVPILFLTAYRDSTTVQQVFAAGADDFATKPIVGPELITRITSRLERMRLIQTLSTRDPLTGLSNPLHSRRELNRLLAQAQHQQQRVLLGVLHVQALRSLSWQYGHEVSQQVLQRIGTILQTTLPVKTVLAYWGEGDFVVGAGLTHDLASSTLQDALTDVLAQIRRQIFNNPAMPDGSEQDHRFQVDCYLGLAEYPEHGSHLRELMQVALTALSSHNH